MHVVGNQFHVLESLVLRDGEAGMVLSAFIVTHLINADLLAFISVAYC